MVVERSSQLVLSVDVDNMYSAREKETAIPRKPNSVALVIFALLAIFKDEKGSVK